MLISPCRDASRACQAWFGDVVVLLAVHVSATQACRATEDLREEPRRSHLGRRKCGAQWAHVGFSPGAGQRLAPTTGRTLPWRIDESRPGMAREGMRQGDYLRPGRGFRGMYGGRIAFGDSRRSFVVGQRASSWPKVV